MSTCRATFPTRDLTGLPLQRQRTCGVRLFNAFTINFVRQVIDTITADFPFFPTFHRLYSTRPNVNPPVIITGVGPGGRRMVHLQPPSASERFPDELIDPTLRNRAATPPAGMLPRRSSTPISGWGSSPVRSFTPNHSPLKENCTPFTTGSRSKVKVEGPNYSAAMLKARQSIKKIPAKRSLEDTLVTLHEYILFVPAICFHC